jgi:hypothetical protein
MKARPAVVAGEEHLACEHAEGPASHDRLEGYGRRGQCLSEDVAAKLVWDTVQIAPLPLRDVVAAERASVRQASWRRNRNQLNEEVS